MLDQRNHNHPKRKKKQRAAARKIKTTTGCLVRYLERKLPKYLLDFYNHKIVFSWQVFE